MKRHATEATSAAPISLQSGGRGIVKLPSRFTESWGSVAPAVVSTESLPSAAAKDFISFIARNCPGSNERNVRPEPSTILAPLKPMRASRSRGSNRRAWKRPYGSANLSTTGRPAVIGCTEDSASLMPLPVS
jgi:hypothetical protein